MSKKLGEIIRAYRKDAKLTQKQLAEKLQKAESTVRMWELGKNMPPLETLKEIGATLNIPLSDLLSKAGYIEKDEYTDEQLSLVMKEMEKIPPYENKNLTLLENLNIELNEKLQKALMLSNEDNIKNENEIKKIQKEMDLILEELQRIIRLI